MELNLGSTIVEYHTSLAWTLSATQNRDVDRLMFPNYMDFLLFVKDETYQRLLQDAFVLTNAIKYPFQIGMAFATTSDNMTLMEDSFLSCMRYQLPTLERQVMIEESRSLSPQLHVEKSASSSLYQIPQVFSRFSAFFL